MTTTEVAERIDLGRRSTYERLARLVDHDRLETKKVGGNGRVWWKQFRELTIKCVVYNIETALTDSHV